MKIKRHKFYFAFFSWGKHFWIRVSQTSPLKEKIQQVLSEFGKCTQVENGDFTFLYIKKREGFNQKAILATILQRKEIRS